MRGSQEATASKEFSFMLPSIEIGVRGVSQRSAGRRVAVSQIDWNRCSSGMDR